MKLDDRLFFDPVEGKYIHKRTFDVDASLNEVKQLKAAGVEGMGESKLVGRVPMWLINEWAKEAGVKWDDPAFRDVIRSKMLSGEFDKLRVWEGTY